MSEQGGVKLTLTHRPKDHEPENGLNALFERLTTSDGGQYVLLRVVPVETSRRRHDGKQIVTVEIRAIEPLVNESDRRAAQSLMEQAARLRLDRGPKAADVPDDMLADLDREARDTGWRDETTGLMSGGLVTDEEIRRARAHRDDEPPDGSTVDAFLANEGYRDPAAAELHTTGAYDNI